MATAALGHSKAKVEKRIERSACMFRQALGIRHRKECDITFPWIRNLIKTHQIEIDPRISHSFLVQNRNSLAWVLPSLSPCPTLPTQAAGLDSATPGDLCGSN